MKTLEMLACLRADQRDVRDAKQMMISDGGWKPRSYRILSC